MPHPLVKLARRGLCIALALSGMLAAAQAHSETEYSFAVVPQFEQRKLFAVWRPIIDELNRRTGIRLKLVATLSVPEFERELSLGSYDFVYTNPYHILREATHQAYIPLVRDEAPLRGIIVVAKNSPIQKPAELDGQRMAIPSNNALGASLLVRADLERLFKAKVIPVNTKTHSSTYLHVANGLLPAGGGVEKTLNEQEPAVRDLLRVLYVTREMPSHPISAHPRVATVDRQLIQKTLLELATTDAGKEMLAKVPIRTMIPTTMADYQPMRAWGLEKYWVD